MAFFPIGDRGAEPEFEMGAHYRADGIADAILQHFDTFSLDVRLREINGRWIASADTVAGPSLGLGKGAVEAVEHALQPFEGIVDELIASLPRASLT